MSPSPFAVSSPTDPASYSWEATDEGVAERFGIPVEQVLRFDLNTSPANPTTTGTTPRQTNAGRWQTPSGPAISTDARSADARAASAASSRD